MELTQILIIVGVIGGIILLIVAVRGSFKSDDDFYGEAPPLPAKPPTPVDPGAASAGDQEPVPPDPDGGDGAG
jgi:hypothetical protein